MAHALGRNKVVYWMIAKYIRQIASNDFYCPRQMLYDPVWHPVVKSLSVNELAVARYFFHHFYLVMSLGSSFRFVVVVVVAVIALP
jgi:hypothetical protein